MSIGVATTIMSPPWPMATYEPSERWAISCHGFTVDAMFPHWTVLMIRSLRTAASQMSGVLHVLLVVHVRRGVADEEDHLVDVTIFAPAHLGGGFVQGPG